MPSWTTDSVAETEAVGEDLARTLDGRGLVLLEGDLGAGKTVLVRGLARYQGVDRREVQSPTYTLIHEHEGTSGRLVHVDLYRLEPEELAALGLDEILAGPGLKAIEWADRWPENPADACRVRIRRTAEGKRRIEASFGASAD